MKFTGEWVRKHKNLSYNDFADAINEAISEAPKNKILCYFGVHDWTKWDNNSNLYYNELYNYQYRFCKNCNFKQTKVLC